MGSYDGAEVCELVGLFNLNSFAVKYGKDYVGLYRDDGLILLKGTSKRLAGKARKDLHKLFAENFQLKITAEICHQIVNFLDLTFNLHEQIVTSLIGKLIMIPFSSTVTVDEKGIIHHQS